MHKLKLECAGETLIKGVGALKPQECALRASNSVVEQNFFTRTEEIGSFLPETLARRSKQYPPAMPSQYGKWVDGICF